MVGARSISIGSVDSLPSGEAIDAERVDVHGLRAPLDDQLGHANADGGRDLEARAAERGGEVQTIDAVDATEDGMAIAAVAVESAVTAGERGPLHGGDTMRHELRSHVGGVRRQSGAERVRIDIPL